jgi:hypothetical protein
MSAPLRKTAGFLSSSKAGIAAESANAIMEAVNDKARSARGWESTVAIGAAVQAGCRKKPTRVALVPAGELRMVGDAASPISQAISRRPRCLRDCPFGVMQITLRFVQHVLEIVSPGRSSPQTHVRGLVNRAGPA